MDIHTNNIEEQVVIFHDQKEKGNKIQVWGKLSYTCGRWTNLGEKMDGDFTRHKQSSGLHQNRDLGVLNKVRHLFGTSTSFHVA